MANPWEQDWDVVEDRVPAEAETKPWEQDWSVETQPEAPPAAATPRERRKSSYEGIPDDRLNFLQRLEKKTVDIGLTKPGEEMISPGSLEQKRLALKTALNVPTAGYLPQIMAALKSGSVSSPEYIAERDAQIADLAQAKGGTKAAGMALGAIPSLATGNFLSPAKSITGKIVKPAAVAGLSGFLSNPGDEAGKLGGLQLGDRAKNAVVPALVGGGLGAVSAAPEIARKLKQSAGMRALKQGGAMLKDYRKLDKQHLLDEAREMLLEPIEMPGGTKKIKVVTPGATVEDVAERAGAIKDAHGDVLKRVYKALDDKFDDMARSPVGDKLLNPSKIADRLEKELVTDNIGTAMEDAVGPVQKEIERLRALGDRAVPFRDIKKRMDAIQKFVDFTREQTPQKELLKQARGIMNNEIEAAVDAIGEYGGVPLYDAWKRSKQVFHFMDKMEAIAKDKVFRETANRFISPSDYGVGAMGTVAAAAKEGLTPMSVAKGASLGALNQAMRRYGNAVSANVSNRAGKALGGATTQQMAEYFGRKAAPLGIGAAQASAANRPADQRESVLGRVQGTPYETMLSNGPEGDFSLRYFSLYQTDPEFRRLLGGK